jgi:hypothetical protein
MSIYYVSPFGSDSNNGLGPDASHATNKPWLTIGKAMGSVGIASGDTLYLAPNTYRQTFTPNTVASVETQIIGDPSNSRGFKNSSGVLLDAGEVIWSAFTTNDTTAPSANPNMNLNGLDFLTFKNILFIGSANAFGIINASTQTSTNIKFIQCVFIPGNGSSGPIQVTCAANTPLHWLFDSCSFIAFKNTSIINLTLTTHTANYDADVIIRNCLFTGNGMPVQVTNAATGGGSGGGVLFLNNTCLSTNCCMTVSSAGTSQTFPCKAENNMVLCTGGTAFVSGHIAQLTENYNYIIAATPRSNVNIGANSVTTLTYAFHVELGQSLIFGQLPRPFFMPRSAPILGFGNSALAPTTDFFQRNRAGGAFNTIGCMEKHDIGIRESTVVDSSTYSLKIVGPGDHEIPVAVDPTSTIISVKVRYDTNHGTTNKPQVMILARPEIGVAEQTLTASVGVDTWETLTFSAITPTAKSWVILRLVSRSAAASGIAYFDTIGIV